MAAVKYSSVLAVIVSVHVCLSFAAPEEISVAPVDASSRQFRTFRLFGFLDNLVDRFVETFLSSQPQPGLFQGGASAAQSQSPSRNSAIGAVCRYSEECRSKTINSVCYNGRCLCSLGYHYSEEKDECSKDTKCPSCPSENAGRNCVGGMDLYCNGTCIGEGADNTQQRIQQLEVTSEKKQLATPNWPEDYPYGVDAYYCLTATSGRRVNLDMRWMDLETNCGSEDCDYIKVYDGCMADDTKNLLVFLNGDNTHAKECVTSSCHKMLVHFHSDPQKPLKRADSRSGVMGFFRGVQNNVNPCTDPDNSV